MIYAKVIALLIQIVFLVLSLRHLRESDKALKEAGQILEKLKSKNK